MADKIDLPVQLVQPDGRRVHRPDYAALVSDVGSEQLRSLYEDMVVARRIDTEATALQRQGQLGIWAPLIGQEAAQVGSVRALDPEDYIFISYREHAVAYCRGVDPAVLTRMWRGCAHSGWDPETVNMTNPALVVGAHGLHATGYAMGVHLDGAEIATVVYFGDGAVSGGDLSEALGFASSFNAPVVFFCENNQWAISEPVQLQSPSPIVSRPAGYGMPAVQVDGNDVLAVLAVTRQAARRAREGAGPSFVEAITYRMGAHTTADDPTRYRTSAELEVWKARDPIDRMRRLLEREGLFDDTFADRVQAHADEVAARLRSGTLETPDPEPDELFAHVYSTDHPLINEERAAYRAYLDTLNPDSVNADTLNATEETLS
ncbi:pyruvate dehydrogenase (acetyl-transferring) E1 component subunit alpha [Rhodococcus xishaensis]|uniref:Pyruvate dehydrogenase (Acetyl-transferring) E1 component subunit alpha n=1 Tax=Rhodococcus xishaensis TaxID=2487364 RepID=A0A438AVC4_9NOCA|nr:pyruvate dehydrogenase (acetyl-transferring) E1 component subunit alpha [Rhodococcus xishaensis]RVW02673.1 pyruvate dehydrogenase (acetyl-transferring) E1 component subunit alpha [Rhodococcus xishaensis]